MPLEKAVELFKKMHNAADGAVPEHDATSRLETPKNVRNVAEKSKNWVAIVAERLEEKEEREARGFTELQIKKGGQK